MDPMKNLVKLWYPPYCYLHKFTQILRNRSAIKIVLFVPTQVCDWRCSIVPVCWQVAGLKNATTWSWGSGLCVHHTAYSVVCDIGLCVSVCSNCTQLCGQYGCTAGCFMSVLYIYWSIPVAWVGSRWHVWYKNRICFHILHSACKLLSSFDA